MDRSPHDTTSAPHEWSTLLDSLERELVERFGLRSASARASELFDPSEAGQRSLAQLEVDVFVGAIDGQSAESSPVYLRKPKLRICQHFEPEVDLLIHDARLGTLAMVQGIDARGGQAIQAQVRQFVDRATYLRHLLLTARDEEALRDCAVVSVELVLVHRPSDANLLHEVGEILRQLAQGTDFLHAIGVNVLAADDQGFAPAALRRAFSWLLHDTGAWFEQLELRRRPAADRAEVGRLRRIELDDYRMPGRRTLHLHADARLHLLHGHNGSGKSSLVEALELMITGSIERLAGIEDYEHVVHNRWSEAPARVELETDAELLSFELCGAARPPRPLAPNSRAASFRLDQTVMDRLARASDVDRAAELLAAFFADEAELRDRWRHALDDADAALGRLPDRVHRWLVSHQRERQDLHEVAVEQLASLAEGQVNAALVDALLPMPRAALRPLLGQLDALAQLEATLERDGFVAGDAPLWDTLEQAFAELAADLPERVSTLESVTRTLDRLERWWQEGQGEGFDSEDAYAEALDEWLELSALVDIADHQARVLAVLADAVAGGWDLRRLDEAGAAATLLRSLATADAQVGTDLARVRLEWSRRRDQLGRGLRRSGDGHEAMRTGVDKAAAVRVELDDDELDALDQFGRWWAPTEVGLGLGRRIRAAIERGEAQAFATADIGVQAWVMPLRLAAAQMLAPLRELRATWGEMAGRRRHPSAPVPAEATEQQTVDDLEEARAESNMVARADRLFDLVRGPQIDDAGETDLEARPVAPQSRRVSAGARTFRGPQRTQGVAPVPMAIPTAPTARGQTDGLGLAAVLERMRHAHAMSQHAHQVGIDVQDSFVMRLAANDTRALGLIDALNELMALFSPARWAYEDVTLRYQESGEQSRLRFETGELRGGEDPLARARADLRLNTAQLNAFTLALFLLCAPRVENPLGLLVLDDPLQNMDELTVTTLARGLAKLMRVLPQRWSLMMLFHGEGDLARFHDEVECGVYFLPWLSPTVHGQQIDIHCQAHDSRLSLASQSIADLVQAWPH